MTHSVPVFQVDAFTTQRFAGNPAGVILDADQLTGTQMQLLARELGNGDSAFVLPPDGDDHDIRVRFFTPAAETGFVGHATVAVHAVLAALGMPPRRRQKQRTGLVEVRTGGTVQRPQISIRQPAPVLARKLAGLELAPVLEALRLAPADMDPRFIPQIAGSASTRLLLGVRDSDVLARVRADLAQLTALSATLGAAGYFLFTTRVALPDCDTESRMFCPALGIAEDPVSGNAHGMLGAYLLKTGVIQPTGERAHFTGAQGHYVGRPGRVTIDMELAGDKLQFVSIGGEAAIVFQTTVAL